LFGLVPVGHSVLGVRVCKTGAGLVEQVGMVCKTDDTDTLVLGTGRIAAVVALDFLGTAAAAVAWAPEEGGRVLAIAIGCYLAYPVDEERAPLVLDKDYSCPHPVPLS